MTRGELIQSVLLEALERPVEERTAFVHAAAPNDEIAFEVLSLLRLDDVVGTEMDPFTTVKVRAEREALERALLEDRASSEAEAGLLAGSRLGRFTLVRELGRGGMSVVYEAVQAQPRRKVALKLLPALGLSEEMRRRLELEAEILGRLRHDGIAQVYDAGVVDTPIGPRPFFAMELIDDARTATDYAEYAKLTHEGRLSLFAHIADAVGHAHDHGIVHRDLKPDNILVRADGRPKVLDFGIAYVANDVTIAATSMTQDGQILGTLAYMAPEQLSGGPKAISARTDVYALGVIGFELFARRRPIELAGMSISAALRAIETTEPPRLRDADRSLRGDAETIVERCLSREPGRRYADANEVTADIRRSLANQPILARPTTTLYRTSRFVRRHRGMTIGLSVAALVLVLGTTVSLLLAITATRERQIAEDARVSARMNEIDAIRGVVRGASLLRGRTESWDAVGQLETIARSRRDWVWRHEALKLPWKINIPDSIGQQPDGAEASRRFSGDREIVFLTQDKAELFALDLTTDQLRRIPFDEPIFPALLRLEKNGRHKVGLLLKDRRIVRVDTRTGAIEPTGLTFGQDEDPGEYGIRRLTVLDDPPGLVMYPGKAGRRSLEVYGEGRPTLTFNDERYHEDSTGPYWEPPVFAAGSPYLVLGRWRRENVESKLITVDRRTHEVVAESRMDEMIPNLAMSSDGAHVFVRADDGVQMRSVLGLDLVDTFSGIGAVGVDPTASPVGNQVLFVGYQTGRVMMISPEREMTRWPELANTDGFFENRSFSTDGRLLLSGEWIIDTDSPIHPDDRAVTFLRGHRSYVYQLAVSPDGSLLASAAPEGDVLLWDLIRERVLARFQRPRHTETGHIVFNMNAPLAFTNDGTALVFGEIDPETDRPGYTRVEFETGERAWTESDSADRVNDDVARAVDARAGGALHPHAAMLPGDRLLLAEASRLRGHHVRIRAMHTDAETFVSPQRAWPNGGVAVRPDGRQFATQEYPFEVVVRDAETLERVARLEGTRASTEYGMIYSPDGERLFIGTEEGRIMAFETEFHKKIAEISAPPVNPDAARNYVYAMAWTPDGARLICSGGSVIRVLESERPVFRDDRAEAWAADLASARRGSQASAAARRVAAIERWSGEPSRDE